MRLPFDGNYPITQRFGENPDIYSRFGLKGHNGVDYGLPNGTPIVAFITGKIIEAVMGDTGYGNYIKIENDKEGGLVAHLQDIAVKVGDDVTEGQLIGHSDNTGFSTGPHLHWGYYRLPRDRSNGYAGYIDQYIPVLIGDFERMVSDGTKYRDFVANNWTSVDQVKQKVAEIEGEKIILERKLEAIRDDLAKSQEASGVLEAEIGRLDQEVALLNEKLKECQDLPSFPGSKPLSQFNLFGLVFRVYKSE